MVKRLTVNQLTDMVGGSIPSNPTECWLTGPIREVHLNKTIMRKVLTAETASTNEGTWILCIAGAYASLKN